MALLRMALLALILAGNLGCSSTLRSLPVASDGWLRYPAIPGAFRRQVVGDPLKAGFFRYQLKLPPGARVEAHKHSIAVSVKVLTGSMYIITDEPLDRSRAQHYAAGTAFVVPAEAWHVEWWDEPTILEGEGIGPIITTYRQPLQDPTMKPRP